MKTKTVKTILILKPNGMGMKMNLDPINLQHRGGKGLSLPPNIGSPTQLQIHQIKSDEDEIVIFTEHGIIIRFKAVDLRTGNQFVRLMLLNKNDSIVGSIVLS